MSIADARYIPETCAPPAFAVPDEPAFDEQAVVIGPNATSYLNALDNQSWRWAFLSLFAIPWFFYRKMYVSGAVSLTAGILLAAHIPLALIGLAFLKGIAAQALYRRFVRTRIAKADARALAGNARHDYLRRAGGPSITAAIFALSVILPLLAAATYLAILRSGWI